MQTWTKLAVGIDVAQKELVVCLGGMTATLTKSTIAEKTFRNDLSGVKAMESWVQRQVRDASGVHYVMEATGVYHETAAYYLDGAGYLVHIVLPNMVSNYMRSLALKTITDKSSAATICQLGLERSLVVWDRPAESYKQMRQLTRERNQLLEERTLIRNQQHAEQSEAEPNKGSLKRMEKRLALLEKQVVEIEKELELLVASDPAASASVSLITTIPGVGFLTATTVLGETNGFNLIRNRRQITSYAGLDVKIKESGTSVKDKTRISKKGNKHLRGSMYMPSMALVRHDERYKATYARLVSRHGVKLKANVAIQRRLLELIYTIFKTQTPYDPAYAKTKMAVTIT